MNKNSKTNDVYWKDRQRQLPDFSLPKYSDYEWLSKISTYLINKDVQTAIELGCNPGITTCAMAKILTETKFSGVDLFYSQEYVNNLKINEVSQQFYYQQDATNGNFDKKFDFVFSCGLIEHFDDITDIVKSHVELVENDGIVFISVPNFRFLQFAYHYLFDRSDLSVHNLEIMEPEIIAKKLREFDLELIEYGYAGRMRFWNRTVFSNRWLDALCRYSSLIFRIFAVNLGRVLPPDSRYYSPWIYVLAKKNENTYSQS